MADDKKDQNNQNTPTDSHQTSSQGTAPNPFGFNAFSQNPFTHNFFNNGFFTNNPFIPSNGANSDVDLPQNPFDFLLNTNPFTHMAKSLPPYNTTVSEFCNQFVGNMTKLSQQMIEDGKKLASLTAEFKSEFDKLVSESMPNTK
mgnify:CR=1 FL=1